MYLESIVFSCVQKLIQKKLYVPKCVV